MVGPVLHQEMLLIARRSQQYVFRWIYAGWLLLQVVGFSYFWLLSFPAADAYVVTDLGRWFTTVFVVQQLILMALVAPAFAAGSITEEKANGTLQYLLTSDLTPLDIVLGKLLGRSLQMGVLALTGLPLFCFLGIFGGVEPVTLLVVLVFTAAALIGLVSASLLASVWSVQTRNAALSLYGAGAVGFLLVWQAGSVFLFFNPVWVLEPAWGRIDFPDLRLTLQRLLGAVLAWGVLAGSCLALAVWRLRPAYRRQLEGTGKKKVRWWTEREPVSDEPITWKERHVEGLSPVPALRRLPRWIGLTAIFAAATASSILILSLHLTRTATLADLFACALRLDFDRIATILGPAYDGFEIQGMVVMLLASMLIGVRCSGAVSGERERQTWEALLLTPLTVRQMIRGKLWGIMGSSYPYLFAYAIPAVPLSLLGGIPALYMGTYWLVMFSELLWTVIWLGVTLLAMYFIGAVGIWCSSRYTTSWRSMFWTLGIGYVGGFLLFGALTPLIAIAALVLILLLYLLSQLLQINLVPGMAVYRPAFILTSCLSLALMCWLAARFMLSSAMKWVAYRERTIQWDEPAPRRRRPRLVRPAR